MRTSIAWSIAVLIAFIVARAPASPVAPGEITGDDADPFVAPTGDMIIDDTESFTITYTAPAGTEFRADDPGQFPGRLHSRVFRDPLTARLTFSYDFQAVRAPSQSPIGNEHTELHALSFAGFTTDVEAIVGGESRVALSRSSGDGAELTIAGHNDGLDDVPTVAVRTNATDFDANGSLRLLLSDEFVLIDLANPDSAVHTVLDTSVDFTETFQPVAQGNGGGGSAIPLPAPAYAGLIGLAAALAAIPRTMRS